MHAAYDDSATLREARKVYFEVNAFGDDGGYGSAWVDFKLGPIPMPFPNTPARVRAVGYHDLHHILTGYETSTLGEFEISAWEIGAGCKGFAAAWMLNLGGMLAGLFVAPRRVFRAFVRGRRSDTLYGQSLDTMLDETVREARDRFVRESDGRVTAADVGLFVLAQLAGLVVGLAMLAIVAPLAPVGVVVGNLSRRRAAQKV
jgi:hypothetical protein